MVDGSTIAEKAALAELRTRASLRVSDLAAELDLPISTAAAVMARLVSRGLAARDASPDRAGTRGRPSAIYRLRLPAPVVVLQFDGTQLVGSIVGRDLRSIGNVE